MGIGGSNRTLAQDKAHWLTWQNDTASTLYVTKGHNYCTFDRIKRQQCFKSIADPIEEYESCLQRSQLRTIKRTPVGQWSNLQEDAQHLNITQEGELVIQQGETVLLKGQLLFHPKDLKVNLAVETGTKTLLDQ